MKGWGNGEEFREGESHEVLFCWSPTPKGVTCGIKLHNSEGYQAGVFTAAPGARGIAPPHLHTESRSVHLLITKLI